ncbi:acetyltransferase family protein [Bacillus mycoides]|uniref:GNAT family N-acetyltransferase n=1 Tax=Bacillus mycoides TaxID=1405 RepID=UPI0001A0512B|nr:GNAT family N-acetyltransferase [Bacillus mycoides]AIW84792.1 acetyltransferase family protein [Bacillus mycoides]EEL05803.1 GCN5-related N-acetyltransferase [Bacillus cereus BDRD-ST196]GAE37997.1 putative acetyltransferase [Bacillus mycoides NBRC 101238 = DSM 11821]HDR7594770.1 GNAT family N-acetyltransferase [Bacillus mycoides]
MTTHIVQSTDYNQVSDALRREIALMLQRVWPDFDPLPEEKIPETHLKEFNVRSFYSYIDGKLVSYAGVVRKTIHHKGQPFNIAGLSCVATDPDYHGQGLGLHTVTAATEWIEKQSDIDFGIFTCKPSLAPFYNRAGSWPVIPDVVLISRKDEDALSSASLEVVVLMLLFSKKAKSHKSMLRHTTINLDFPVDQFL